MLNNASREAEKILTDNCGDDDDNDWAIPEEASSSREASVTIKLGCMKNIKEIRLKNIKRKKGGTKKFTIFLSETNEGPWKEILNDEFPEPEAEGCAASHVIDLEYYLRAVYSSNTTLFRRRKLHGLYLRFQVNSTYGSMGGLQYLGQQD